MRIGSNVDHTILFLYLKEFPIHSILFSRYNQNFFLGSQLVIKLFYSLNLQLIPEGNFNMVVGHVQGACMLIIRKFL